MRDIEESFMYQSWLHSQYEPEEHLFLGRSKPLPKDLPGWMMKQPPKHEEDWEEKERRGEELLKREGLI